VAVRDTKHCGGKPVWTASSGSNSSHAAGVLPTALTVPRCPCCWDALWGCSPSPTSTCEYTVACTSSYDQNLLAEDVHSRIMCIRFDIIVTAF
jgi:hypothetical protein